jgi:transcriptional antiterminator NusG
MDDPNLPIPQSSPAPLDGGGEPAPVSADAASLPAAPESPGPAILSTESVAAETERSAEVSPAEAPAPVVAPAAELPLEPPAEPAATLAAEPAPVEPAPEPLAAAPETESAGEATEEKAEGKPVEASPPPASEPTPVPPAPAQSAAEAQAAESAVAPPPAPAAPKSEKMDWYILKVQSNREESIREGLRKRVAIAGLDPYFGDIIIPTEKVTEFKAGKRKVFKRKLYPGYLVVQMEINEDTWFLVRETPGIGDFTGAAGHPTPMQAREVASILAKQEEKTDEAPRLKINFRVGDHVKIKEGTFENFEGEVANIDETNGRVTVLINIFGRSTPVDIEYWQIEAV